MVVYHLMMVATNHLPACICRLRKITVHLVWRCWLDLNRRGNIGWDLAWFWIWWLGYRDGDGWVGRVGWLGLDSLTGLVWLGSLLADHRLGVVTGHVVELHSVAKQQNNSRSASGIKE